MLRWLLLCILLSAAGVSLVYFLSGSHHAPLPTSPPAAQASSPPPPSSRPTHGGRILPLGELVEFSVPTQAEHSDTIIIPNSRLVIAEQQEVPSEQEGKLIFIGTDIKPGEKVADDKRITARFGYLAIHATPDDKTPREDLFRFDGDPTGTTFRRWKSGDPLDPGHIKVGVEDRAIRKLQVGDWVERGQLLALVNPDLAFDNLSTKVSSLNAAESERLAALAAKEEAGKRVKSIQNANRLSPGAVSQEDYRGALLAQVTKEQEERAKEAKVQEAQREVNGALTKLKMHEIHAAIPGLIKAIYKNIEGDAVKALESVVQLQNPYRLRLEGLIEVQEAQKLKRGMEVIVEPTRPVPPELVMGGHLEAITCVAVTKGERPIIISGSEDHTLGGWDSKSGQLLWRISTDVMIPRALACTAYQSSRNLVLFGGSDGSAYLLDLDKRKEKPRPLADRHTAAINSVAFSPDGEVCITAGDDRMLRLWNTASGELLHSVSAHQNAVTSVQFASPTRVVSAGRDGRLSLWSLEDSKLVRSQRIEGRSGDVAELGVSPDGREVLFDQGKELRILSLESQQIHGTIQNNSATTSFSTFALFAPDGKTILTNGGGSGLMQLWRTPKSHGRASALREFIWNTGVITCATFSSDGTFAVTGTQDHQVLLWRMPIKDEVERLLTARLILVEKHLDTSSRQVRVWAELDNPGWLIPGGSATMVVPPSAGKSDR